MIWTSDLLISILSIDMALKSPPKGSGLYKKKLRNGEERYQSRLWSPPLGRIGKKHTWTDKDLNLVLKKHYELKAAYEANNYDLIIESPKSRKYPEMVLPAAALYEKYLRDDPDLVPIQKAKNRDSHYIRDTVQYIKTFLLCLQENGYKLSHTHLSAIDDQAVTYFYNHLEDRYEKEEIGVDTWNRHITACRNWLSVLHREFDYDIKNPFYNIIAKQKDYDPQFLEMEEFSKFLQFVNDQNGWSTKGKTRVERINYYRSGLKELYIMSAFIGARPKELLLLTWHNIIPNYVVVTNSKLENNLNYQGKKEYIYIHPDLATVLAHLRSHSKSEDDYVLFPDWSNRKGLQEFASKAFKHFIKKSGITKKVTFYNLRHTYINALFALIGEEGLDLHHNKETAIRHYLSKKRKLNLQKDKRLFNIDTMRLIQS